MIARTNRRALLAVILAVAAILRLVHANAELWYDEIITVQYFVRPAITRIVTEYGFANNHVMNSLLAHATTAALGEDPWVVRLPAIVFGVVGIWAFWFVARELWSERMALSGTALYAFSYHHIYYSQNGRGYSALMCFALIATGLAFRMAAASARRTPDWVGVCYAASIGLGLYAMLLMAFVAAGHALVWTGLRRWRELGWLAAGCGVGAILYAPMTGSLIEYYRSRPTETGFALFSGAFLASVGPLAIVLVVAAPIAIWLFVRLARRKPFAAAFIAAPLLLNVVVPLARGQGVYPRSFSYALPVAYLMAIEGLDWLGARAPRLVPMAAAVVVAPSLILLWPYYQLPKQGFRQALAYIETHRAASDGLIGFTIGGKAARFYDPTVQLVENVKQLTILLRASSNPVWIVTTFPNEMATDAPDLSRWLDSGATRAAEFPGVIADGTVHVYLWKPTTP